jgi:hypothetical protein
MDEGLELPAAPDATETIAAGEALSRRQIGQGVVPNSQAKRSGRLDHKDAGDNPSAVPEGHQDQAQS